jgi:hypothetical protein
MDCLALDSIAAFWPFSQDSILADAFSNLPHRWSPYRQGIPEFASMVYTYLPVVGAGPLLILPSSDVRESLVSIDLGEDLLWRAQMVW